jgi:hypothetical protein
VAMITMRCPQCGQSANIPDELVDEGHPCYKCGSSLEIAYPAVAARRARARSGQLRGMVIGAGTGASTILAFGFIGGPLGGAIAGAVAGATLGVVTGFVEGLIGGSEWAVLMWDGSWLSTWAKLSMALGGIAGLLLGLSGDFFPEYGQGAVLAWGGLGGLCLGGLFGARVGRQSTEGPESQASQGNA